MITLDDLRRFTVARNFFTPTTLKRALHRMGFVQADPIRAPARAQDLILRHRVKNYHAGDLERRYATLDIEEDFFVIYGFVTRSLQALMHPRSDSRVPADEDGRPWPAGQRKRAQLLLEFVRERGAVHPREVDEHFSHGKVKNYWGGSSNATTHLLDAMHYRGLLRVARRENGIRIYRAHQHEPGPTDAAERRARIDALVDVVVRIYAPLPGPSLSFFVRRLRFAVPQWQAELTSALQRAKERLVACARRWRRLVLAGRMRMPMRRQPRCATGYGALAGALRSGGAGPRAFRAVVGLGIPFRSLHTRGETQTRLLRHAAALARPRDWLGQPLSEEW